MLFSAVSDTSDLVSSLDCPLLIVIPPPVVWAAAVISWASGDISADSLIRVAIVACVGLKAFSAFTQDNAIYWDVDELYSANVL